MYFRIHRRNDQNLIDHMNLMILITLFKGSKYSPYLEKWRRKIVHVPVIDFYNNGEIQENVSEGCI
jgi:hypothetical protein